MRVKSQEFSELDIGGRETCLSLSLSLSTSAFLARFFVPECEGLHETQRGN